MTLALNVDKSGRVRAHDAHTQITYNDPWPCPASNAGVTGKMDGLVLHTMVGFLAGTIALFNRVDSNGRSTAPGSAHFGISQAGRLHQFVPLGGGFETWHAFDANHRWYGAEFEDAGNPHTPISDAALTIGAQLFELLSRFAGFKLQVTDDCHGQGLAYHRMCTAWNTSLHSCPGASFSDMVRVNQRAEIVHRAHLIREPAPVPPASPIEVHADGHTTWAQLAARHGLKAEHLVWQTAGHAASGFGPLQGQAVDHLGGAVIPAGTVVWVGTYPAPPQKEQA